VERRTTAVGVSFVRRDDRQVAMTRTETKARAGLDARSIAERALTALGRDARGAVRRA